jgi:hypothetical protein
MKRPRWRSVGLTLLAAVAISACGNSSDGPSAPEEQLPDEPDPTYGDGHWTKDQRGIALDENDLDVLVESSGGANVGITADRIRSDFGLLVLDRPYLENRFSACTDPDDAPDLRPRHRAEEIIGAFRDRGITFDRVAVNVDLLQPSRHGLLYQCFQHGSSEPRFGVPEHREAVKAAFVELATLPGLEYITVGLDLDTYYHLKLDGGQPLVNDYSNLVSLYREIYTAVKATNPDVKVGPGISWTVFRNRTVPAIAAELALDPSDDLLAVYRAWQRTVAPLLSETTAQGKKTYADYLGISVVPAPAEAPYRGQPAPTGDDEQAVLDFYRDIPIVAAGLPVVFPQIDWPVRADNLGSQKAAFLTLFQKAVSPVNVEWAAWRRLSDLPETNMGASKCAAFTGSADPDLAFPPDYCYAGLIGQSGRARDVLDVMTAAPSSAADQ